MSPEQLVISRDSTSAFEVKAAPVAVAPLQVLNVIAGVHSESGGPPECFQASCLALADTGISVCAVYPVDSTRRDEAETVLATLAAAGIKVRAFELSRLFPRRSRAWGVSWPLGIWLVRNAQRYDVVHAHGAWTFTTLAALIGARRGRRPLALTPHETLTEFDVAKKSLLSRTVKRVLRYAYGQSVDLVVFSSHIEQQASRGGMRRRAAVTIPHPVGIRPRSPQLSRTYGGQTLRLGFLGRFDNKKNLDLLIEAASRCPYVELRIAGAGPEEQRLRSLSEHLEIGDRAVWLGFLTGAEREDFFASIDLLMMPSAFECFGMAAAEAIARGVPVLVTPTMGVSEIVERHGCGVIAEPNARAITEQLQSFHEDRAVLQDLAARTHRAAADLSTQRHGERLRREYERLVRAL
jgi:glycosyltransferase involved in cell wall biosynthesis